MRIDRRESLYDELLRETIADRPLFDQEAIQASVNLALTYDVLQSYSLKYLSLHGLAKSSFNLMALLRHAHPEGLQLSEIGELLITSRANITGLVDHLEQKGYVKREVDVHDRRARVARLTTKGEALIDEVLPVHKDRAVAFFSNLNLEEVQQLKKLLKKLRSNPSEVSSENEDSALYHSVFVNED